RSISPSRARPDTRAAGGNNPMRPRKICVLPAPDSPITPRQRPRAISKDTPSTVVCAPKPTLSASTRKSNASFTARLAIFAQPLTQQIERDQQDRQQRRGHQQHPRRRLHLLRAFVDET